MLAWLWRLQWWQASILMLLQNATLLWGTVAVGDWASRRWSHRRVAQLVQDDRVAERRLGYVSVLMNTVVTLSGWLLWKHGTVKVSGSITPLAFGEVLVLAAVLDAQMYVGHRIAHHRLAYPLVHKLHHRFVEPQAATLFALHPLEALGFGGMWLISLVLISALGYSISVLGVVGFAFVNLAFGTISHVGVDPLPDRVRASGVFKWVSTPAFHVGHHLNPVVNFGSSQRSGIAASARSTPHMNRPASPRWCA